MTKKHSSYNQILKSTSIFGGSQFVSIIIGLIRTKIVAVLLGTAGVGLIGIYQSIIDMTRSLSGLGLDTGGVKEIAASNSANDYEHLRKTASIFNQWFMLTAWIGLFVCIVFCLPISIWAFGDVSYAMPIAALSVCIFLVTLATGRSVILQGLRQIGFMAKAAIWSSLIGLLVTVPLYYFLGTEGIIPAFIASSLALYFCTEYYYRRLKIKKVKLDDKETFEAGLNTLKLGLYIVLSAIISAVSMFLIRTYLIRTIDVEAAGLFQSAWVITSIYLGLILKSMGADFFPRLCSIVDDRSKVTSLINEQTYIVLVVASPIIVGMLVFSDCILSVLYSSDFTLASSILQWQILGTFLKVLAWPIAFVLLARNKGLLFLISEILFFATYLLSFYFLFPYYGLTATGIGFFIAYVVYLPTVFIMGKSLSGFSWSGNVVQMIFVNLVLISIVFYFIHYQSEYVYIGGCAIFLMSLIYAYFKLKRVFTIDDLKGWFKQNDSEK